MSVLPIVHLQADVHNTNKIVLINIYLQQQNKWFGQNIGKKLLHPSKTIICAVLCPTANLLSECLHTIAQSVTISLVAQFMITSNYCPAEDVWQHKTHLQNGFHQPVTWGNIRQCQKVSSVIEGTSENCLFGKSCLSQCIIIINYSKVYYSKAIIVLTFCHLL